MLNHSLRRVARTCSTTSSPAAPARPTTPAVASFTSYAHQRRHSSSKPPVPPNNGSTTLPNAVKQVASPASDSKRAAADLRLSRRKIAKEAKADSQYYNWTTTLPSVPSLQHLNPKDVYVAAFFGTHRPISISGPITPEASMDNIDKMFQPKPKRTRPVPQEVIYTLSSTLENLDEQISSKRASHTAEQKAHLIKALVSGNANLDPDQTHHLDGNPQSMAIQGGNVKIALQEIARRFRPYNAPPAPTPAQDIEPGSSEVQDAAAEEMQAQALETEVQEQEYDLYIEQAVLNVPKGSALRTGDFFTSHEARLAEIEHPLQSYEIENPENPYHIQDPSIQPSMGRRRGPGLYRITNRSRTPTMMAISVKRQRRLKMKKHKFKKLTRRVRNLKMRQGKI
ncbi:hypothetical protein PV10_03703 [Exophiala mesophila]|uniref:Small ribosomal subunit protein mS38 n=1 Tax=Exophiala mesophila TaxID=212818 RepID=A0A0D2A028_EXOME|nr:uncharacterized protein PV10_03703 [Exophiala mesophila]KIV92403.1 hypothetical protein PV10_03703 [Exophiala mesophila]